MLNDLEAESDIRGGRINLSWAWSGAEPLPGFRLLRRRRSYPRAVDDGAGVLDLDDLFAGVSAPAVRVSRSLYLPRNAEVEGALQMAELALHSADTGAGPDFADGEARPYRAVVGYAESSGDYQRVNLTEVSRVARSDLAAAPWDRLRRLEIFVTPGGGPEVSAGRVEIRSGHDDGLTPDRFDWIPDAGPAAGVTFDSAVEQSVSVRREERYDPDSGNWKRRILVEDGGLMPEQIYYYRIFAPDPADPGAFRSEPDWRAAVMATGRHGLGDHLYRLLPSLHQYHDEPDPAMRGQGQLRRFLEVFGAGLDQARSFAEGLQLRHDLHEAHLDVLPSLARWIGWRPDRTLDGTLLRFDLLHAPEIYRTIGTVPNLRAMVSRITGWDCEIKEFANNVLLSNAPEPIRLWEIWQVTHDGSSWSQPQQVTRSEGFDGRPSLLRHAGADWLVWHADRDGSRDLWLRRRDGVGGAYRARLGDGRDLRPRPINEYPVAVNDGARLWLFWDSNRDGAWDIWGAWDDAERPFESRPAQPAMNLTEHAAEARSPAAVREASGRIWLFWQSDRRGPTEIWARVRDPVAGWDLPQRVTTARFRHERPAAVLDGDGRLWLFFSEDRGDRSNLMVTLREGEAWSAPVALTDGAWRDEAPAAVLRDGQVWLFWQSDRDGHWQVLGQVWAWDDTQAAPAAAAAPFAVTAEPAADKEPSAFVDGSGDLLLVWRSQRRGRAYQSRSIDTEDAEMLANLGSFQDRAHYTYDTGRTDQDWYARDTVGIYLTPDADRPDLLDRSRRLIEGPLREFLPITVRPLLFIMPTTHREQVYTYDFPEIEPQRTIVEVSERATTGVEAEIYAGLGDVYSDTVPEWVWLRAWVTGHMGPGSTDADASPVDTSGRTWHIGVQPGGV